MKEIMSDPINPYAPPQAEILPAADPSHPYPLASPWRRLGAAIVDGLIVGAISMPLMWLSGYFTRATQMALEGRSWTPEALLWAVVGIAIMVGINWNHLAKGQTIGKGLLQLRIVRKDGSPADRNHIILKRLLPVQIAAQVPVIGGLAVLVDCLCIFRGQRNTLHDDIADTKVVDLR
jgi:uncharacterized RDD family membrane protein YckC